MSVFWCDLCNHLIDGDFSGCLESPVSKFGNICEDCSVEHEADESARAFSGMDDPAFLAWVDKQIELSEKEEG